MPAQPEDLSPRQYAEQGLVTYFSGAIDDKVISVSSHTARADDSFEAVVTEIADHLVRVLRPLGG